MLRKNDLHIRITQEKSYQNDEVFFLGFEKVLKMQPSVIELTFMQSVLSMYLSSIKINKEKNKKKISSSYIKKTFKRLVLNHKL